MPTAGDIVYANELEGLEAVAAARVWPLRRFTDRSFLLGLSARDGLWWHLLVDCEGYKAVPAAWHWSSSDGSERDTLKVTPQGSGGYFHGSRRICAPWNRLSYKSVDPEGPHGDWHLANWISNPKTGLCRTLSAMALRMYVELNSDRYQGRRAA